MKLKKLWRVDLDNDILKWEPRLTVSEVLGIRTFWIYSRIRKNMKMSNVGCKPDKTEYEMTGKSSRLRLKLAYTTQDQEDLK